MGQSKNIEIEYDLIRLLLKYYGKILFGDNVDIKVEKIEGPDFILSTSLKKVGVEITRSLNENDKTIFSHKIDFGPLYTNFEEIVSSQIIKSINKKIDKFESYKKLDENILLIDSESYSSTNTELVTRLVFNFLRNTEFFYNKIILKLSNELIIFEKDSVNKILLN